METAATDCMLCGKTIGSAPVITVNDRPACTNCVEKIKTEIAAQQPTPRSIGLGTVGGLLGALIGALIWSAIAIATDYEVGYVAVLVGWLCGFGARIISGTRGKPLQIIAVVSSLLGLIAAKYFIFAHFLGKAMAAGEQAAAHVSYASSLMLSLFLDNVSVMLSPFDILWVVLAVATAWREPGATLVAIKS